MKNLKMKLSTLKVKSFTTQLSNVNLETVKGGLNANGSSVQEPIKTTPDNTPLTSTDKPIDLPATGVFCPTGGINWCPN